MSLDSFMIHGLARELDQRLGGARIDKIFMPRPAEVVLAVRTEQGNQRLMLSCGGTNPGAYFTSLRPENPPAPPMLCMLLRKHMQGGRILRVEQPEGERMLTLSFTSTDELGRQSEKKLVLELLGKHLNLLLLDEADIILGCVKKVDYDMSPDRALLPGLKYRLPEAPEAPSVFGLSEDALSRIIGQTPWIDLPQAVAGVSPAVARELEARALAPAEAAFLLYDLAHGGARPFLVRRGGEDFDISPLPITRFEDGESVLYPDFSSLLDDYYRARRGAELKKNLTASLKKTLDNHKNRLERKLGKQRQELLTAQNREDMKKKADLINANIYAIRSGDDKAVVTDYFAEGMPQLTITLDPDLSPQQNAQLLYKRYARLKNAELALTGQIEAGESELQYIESLLYGLELAADEKDIRELEQEAAAAGYTKKSQSKKKKPEKAAAFAPKRYVTSGGFTLLRGRNNRENDQLTMRTAKGGDLWFHARNIPGSHVILVTEGREPDVRDLEEAAALAARWSKAGNSPRVAVDYTRAKHVKKPQGARAGMVNYFEFKTMLIEPRDLEEN